MRISILVIIAVLSFELQSKELTNLQLFYRCYSHLTGEEPMPNDALVVAVKAGDDAIDTCIDDVLGAAQLTSAGEGQWTIDAGNPIAVKVFNNFYKMHASWFGIKDIPFGSIFNGTNAMMDSIYDKTQPSLYYTRALFDPAVRADYFLTTSDYLRAKRSEGRMLNEDGAFHHLGRKSGGEAYVASDFLFGSFDVAYDGGHLIGLHLPTVNHLDINGTSGVVNYPVRFRNINPDKNSITVFPHYGGGVVGSGIYLAKTLEEEFYYYSDGESLVPRNWAKHAFKDVLCRDIPVVRKEDAAPFYDAASTAPFRKGTDCLRCHSTIDRMAATVKSAGFMETRSSNGTIWVPWVSTHLQNKGVGSEVAWSSEKRDTYIDEDHIGHLFYRTYEGKLVSQVVDSVDDIGMAFSKEVDPYLCVTKRYYNYFMRVDVDVDDPGANPTPMPAWEKEHKDFVVSLAKDVAGLSGEGAQQPRKSLRTVIEGILRSPNYKLSNYGVPNE
jgi:hypothetical protein